MCVLLQVETLNGVESLAAIASTEGVDGVFFGPADLSAAGEIVPGFSVPSLYGPAASSSLTVAASLGEDGSMMLKAAEH